MSLGNLYDSIAKYYAHLDFFQINSSALMAAMEQLQMSGALTDGGQRVLDLGSGDGKLLMLVHEIYPAAQLVAVDTSADMLNLRKPNFPALARFKPALPKWTRDSHSINLIWSPPALFVHTWDCRYC